MSRIAFICVAPALFLALALEGVAAQDSSGVRQLQAQVRVRVDLQGVDSTEWVPADIRHDTEGCELVQLRTVAWKDGASSRGTGVAMNDRALLKRRNVRDIQTRGADSAPWVQVDLPWFKRWQGPTC